MSLVYVGGHAPLRMAQVSCKLLSRPEYYAFNAGATCFEWKYGQSVRVWIAEVSQFACGALCNISGACVAVCVCKRGGDEDAACRNSSFKPRRSLLDFPVTGMPLFFGLTMSLVGDVE